MLENGRSALIPAIGEQVLPTTTEFVAVLERLHRYLVASRLSAGKRVLDAASGEGFGAALLARSGAHVTGVDIDGPTVEAARRRYPNVAFVQADPTHLPFADGHFDLITSFETLEHVPDPHRVLDEFRRVLKPEGLLVVSTPAKETCHQPLAEPEPFHLNDVEQSEFVAALNDRFNAVRIYGQRVISSSLLASPSGGAPNTSRRGDDGGLEAREAFEGAMYLLAACSNAAVPSFPFDGHEAGAPKAVLSSGLGDIAEGDAQLRELRRQGASAPGEAPAAASALAEVANAAREAPLAADAKLQAARRAEAQALAERDEAQRRLQRRSDEFDLERLELEARHSALQQLLEHLSAAPRRSVVAALKQLVGDVFFSLKRMRRGPREALRALFSLRAIRGSALFIESYYLFGRPDLRSVDPVRHYFLFGAQERRDPSPLFSAASYLRRYPQVAKARHEPLAHYCRFGHAQGWIAIPTHELSPVHGSADRPPVESLSDACAPDLVSWPAAEYPRRRRIALDPYETRPHDAVPREAVRAGAFITRHRLRRSKPDLQGAIDTLNRRGERDPIAGPPVVSVVISLTGDSVDALLSLDSLVGHHSRARFEIILVDGGASPLAEQLVRQLKGVVYSKLATADNAAWIAGASLARGRVLIFLDAGCRVVENWMDELVDALDQRPAAGAVQSLIFAPDSGRQDRMRDAGADPNRPEHCYARPIQEIAGASLALPADLWRSWADKPRCDAELAAHIRAAGREIWFQPLSRVISYRTAETPASIQAGVSARLARRRPRVLVLDACTPTPDQDAGSVTSVKVMNVFQALGFDVTFAANGLLFDEKYMSALQRVGVHCLYAPYVESIEDHLHRHGAEYQVIHVFRHQVMRPILRVVRESCPNAILMLNNMDLHYLRLQRQAELEGRPGDREALAAMKLDELRTMRQSDIIFVPSAFERDVLSAEQIIKPVEIMPYMVDPQAPIERAAGARDIVFLGGFNHSPNVDAVLWFHTEIWPAVQAECPGARFMIVGSHPPKTIQALRSAHVVVTGRVDDLRPVFENAQVFVAPLRYGAGVKGKLYSAMAYGAPIVTTSIGAEGIGLTPDRDALIADTPAAFAKAVIRTFNDPTLAQTLAAAGPSFVAENATLAAGVAVMRRALEKAAADRRQATVW